MSKKDRIETLIVGVGLMLLGIFMIILAIALPAKQWFTVPYTVAGTIFAQRGYNYLKENFNKKRGH